MNNQVYIFDTTLRDGEQSPGASLNIKEKIEIAKTLEQLQVDVIEAGFPISSRGDFKSVKTISTHIKNTTIAALARASEQDINAAYEALKDCKNKRIHTFLATSDIHLKYKLKMDRNSVLEKAVHAVKYAKNLGVEVEFSAEDAARTDLDYLCKITESVIAAGADIVNIPDTVGYALPNEFAERIKTLFNKVSNIDQAIISVHCHNDLGLAVANTLEAITNGARQIECTINGLGERAGNAALEEIIMTLKTRQNALNLTTNINTKNIYKTSRLVSNLTGIAVQRNKAIVGANAFAHEAGIHQHGVLSHTETYEIMTPESIGLKTSNIVLGKHSGRHAFINKLEKLGYSFEKVKIDELFFKFKELADKKKDIFDEDIQALATDEFNNKKNDFLKLKLFSVLSGNQEIPHAKVKIIKDGKEVQASANGDGPVDAAYNAIEKVAGIELKLEDYNIRAISRGKDAMGEVIVQVSASNLSFYGKGTSTDIVEASIKAYVDAVNKILRNTKLKS
ncbi:MAG: 2-isopropylmalate synthase [bacterium]|nr:2-isopropylmalate synthase [bacterium]